MPRNLLVKDGLEEQLLSLYLVGQELLTGRFVNLPLAISKYTAVAGNATG